MGADYARDDWGCIEIEEERTVMYIGGDGKVQVLISIAFEVRIRGP